MNKTELKNLNKMSDCKNLFYNQFYSFCFHNFKLNSIKTLVHRAYNISSNYFLFHLELEFLKQYFFNNSYPRHILDTHISRNS